MYNSLLFQLPHFPHVASRRRGLLCSSLPSSLHSGFCFRCPSAVRRRASGRYMAFVRHCVALLAFFPSLQPPSLDSSTFFAHPKAETAHLGPLSCLSDVPRINGEIFDTKR